MKRKDGKIYCDICGKTVCANPEYLEPYSFKDGNGNKSDLFICNDCRADDKVVRCFGCGCYLRPEDVFSFRKAGRGKYCRQCVEQAIEEKLQEIEDAKAKLKRKTIFERRKAERE